MMSLFFVRQLHFSSRFSCIFCLAQEAVLQGDQVSLAEQLGTNSKNHIISTLYQSFQANRAMKLKFNFLRVTFFTTNIGRHQRCLVRLDEAADAAESRQVGLHLCDYCMALLLYNYWFIYVYIYICVYIICILYESLIFLNMSLIYSGYWMCFLTSIL